MGIAMYGDGYTDWKVSSGNPRIPGQTLYCRNFYSIAILIWIMIYPMMLKVDFQSVKQVGKNPKGLFITWIVNWL